jgi:hypothetical protein
MLSDGARADPAESGLPLTTKIQPLFCFDFNAASSLRPYNLRLAPGAGPGKFVPASPIS